MGGTKRRWYEKPGIRLFGYSVIGYSVFSNRLFGYSVIRYVYVVRQPGFSYQRLFATLTRSFSKVLQLANKNPYGALSMK